MPSVRATDEAAQPEKDGSVTYSCPPDHVNHGQRYTWRIAEGGELVEKR